MSEVARFGALLSAGVNLHTALEITGFRLGGDAPIERMLSSAIESGAPIKSVTKRLAAFELDLERFRLELDTANAVPVATRKLLLWLPALSVAIGQLAGFGTLAALFHPIGLLSALIALGLIALGGEVVWRVAKAGFTRATAPSSGVDVFPAITLLRRSTWRDK